MGSGGDAAHAGGPCVGSGSALASNIMASSPESGPLSPDEIAGILDRLSYPDFAFPEAEFAAAVARPDEFVPHLLRILEDFADHPREYFEDRECAAPFVAMYLLAQFREVRALPLLLRICTSVPAKLLDAILDDVITTDLGAILASVSGGETAGLRALTESIGVDKFVRAAGLEAMQILLIDGVITRDELLGYVSTLAGKMRSERDDDLWTVLTFVCTDLGFGELREPITWAWRHNLISPRAISWRELEHALSRDAARALEKLRKQTRLHRIDDAARRMEWLGFFQPPLLDEPPIHLDDDRDDIFAEALDPHSFVREGAKVGRNEPCPCGSGKKYKKCCGK